jgi:hypothetical protein
MTKDASGMRGIRRRNPNGPLRQKRGDTHIKTIEEKYNRDFGVRGDMHLDTLLRRKGVDSLHQLIETDKGRR